MKLTVSSMVLALFMLSCKTEHKNAKHDTTETVSQPKVSKFQHYDSLFMNHSEFIADEFDFPVGKPNAKGYYNAQKFGENYHLGDDWNGTGGGNTDLGDPIYAIGNGYVDFSQDIGGGWGNVIRIIHKFDDRYYESIYAHCDSVMVHAGMFVEKGKQIGTIGTADGQYLAHLHLEVRDSLFMNIGPGYSENTEGYLDPTTFINQY